MKRIVSITLALLLMVTLLSSCGGGNGKTSSNGETIINIRIMNEIQNIDKVIAVYKERVKDDAVLSKITPNITYVGGPDYKDKLSMAITAHEDYDLMFVGAWQGLSNFTTTGVFKDVSSYFGSDEYPGLKAAFSKELIDASKVGDALYSIPLVECFEDLKGLTYREDLRVKYNIPEITNDEILKRYLQAIKDNEPDLIPWVMSGQGFMLIDSPDYKAAHDNIFVMEIVGKEAKFYVALDETGTKVIDVVVMGDSLDRFAKLPEGYRTDFITESYIKKLRWVPYLNEDRIGGGIEGRDAAATYKPISLWATDRKGLKDKLPDAELGFYVTEEAQRNMEEGAIVSEMKCNNFLCVPSWSKKTDEVMAFLNWMFGSKENHDLIQYGIEGEDWEAVGDDGFRLLDINEANKYTMPAYSFTHNPNYIRYNETVSNNPKIKAYMEYQNSEKPYKVSPLAGFAFNPSNVKTEVASVQALADALKLNMGIYGDETAAVTAKFNADATKVGLDKIRTELVKQVQEFLDKKQDE